MAYGLAECPVECVSEDSTRKWMMDVCGVWCVVVGDYRISVTKSQKGQQCR
jgi:hypothetical protein